MQWDLCQQSLGHPEQLLRQVAALQVTYRCSIFGYRRLLVVTEQVTAGAVKDVDAISDQVPFSSAHCTIRPPSKLVRPASSDPCSIALHSHLQHCHLLETASPKGIMWVRYTHHRLHSNVQLRGTPTQSMIPLALCHQLIKIGGGVLISTLVTHNLHCMDISPSQMLNMQLSLHMHRATLVHTQLYLFV